MLNTEYPARFERLAADFTTLASRTADAKLSHIQYDFGQLTLQVARLLDGATDTGVFPEWHKLRERLASRIAAGTWPPIPTEPDARLCLLFTLAISSWLAKDYADELLQYDAQLDWKHYRPEQWSVKTDGKDKPTKYSRPFVQDESNHGEPDGDEADTRHRLTARAKNYADVCRLLARLARPTDTEDTAETQTRMEEPKATHLSDELSSPMSKAEIARRVLGEKCRFRKLDMVILPEHLVQVSAKRWQVCLNKLDKRTRSLLEEPDHPN